MIQLPDGGLLVETPAELPNFVDINELFLDVETARIFDNKKHGGLYPFGGDRICGVAVTVEDDPRCWYVPVRHESIGAKNLPVDAFQRWLKDTILASKYWINHNILLDMMFCQHDGVPLSYEQPGYYQGYVVDTLTLAKVHYSDKFGYGLDALMRDWFGQSMPAYDHVLEYLRALHTKNYAQVPPDIMGRYACGDVRDNRKLYRMLVEKRPEQCVGIWNTEILLTPVLFDMELRGLQTNRQELKLDKLRNLHTQIQLGTELAQLTDREFTNSHACIYDILINQYSLPVLATKWEKGIDTGRPTFDKNALKLYNVHPEVLANEEIGRVVKLITAYRSVQQHQSLFVDPFLELMDEFQRIHPTYNQLVRTGRMSCKRPNAQQQNKRSKALIHPRPGYGIIDMDYSQIEFRLIVHYTNDLDSIRAYNENPDMDFHVWVSNMIGVKRRPGKTMNFMIGYGAGKRKVEKALAADPDIIEDVISHITQVNPEHRNAIFHEMCARRAAEVYSTYHEKFPNIKPTSNQAMEVCKYRGYVFNKHGRRRHLEPKFAHKAFNSIVQGDAMDLIKERMVAVAPRYNQYVRDWDIHLNANVHDANVFECPTELLYNPQVHGYLRNVLEHPDVTYKIPIRVGLGVSRSSWAEAAGDDTLFEDGAICKGEEAAKRLADGGKLIGGKVPEPEPSARYG